MSHASPLDPHTMWRWLDVIHRIQGVLVPSVSREQGSSLGLINSKTAHHSDVDVLRGEVWGTYFSSRVSADTKKPFVNFVTFPRRPVTAGEIKSLDVEPFSWGNSSVLKHVETALLEHVEPESQKPKSTCANSIWQLSQTSDCHPASSNCGTVRLGIAVLA